MKTYFSKVDKAAFEGEIDSKKTGLFILKNDNGLELSVTNFGARVVELFVPDRNGNFADVVLGHASLDKYVNFPGERFYGATIGRFGNRIAGGKFTLNGKEYTLPQNDGNNCLHGGIKGFDMKVWDIFEIALYAQIPARGKRRSKRRAAAEILGLYPRVCPRLPTKDI